MCGSGGGGIRVGRCRQGCVKGERRNECSRGRGKLGRMLVRIPFLALVEGDAWSRDDVMDWLMDTCMAMMIPLMLRMQWIMMDELVYRVTTL